MQSFTIFTCSLLWKCHQETQASLDMQIFCQYVTPSLLAVQTSPFMHLLQAELITAMVSCLIFPNKTCKDFISSKNSAAPLLTKIRESTLYTNLTPSQFQGGFSGSYNVLFKSLNGFPQLFDRLKFIIKTTQNLWTLFGAGLLKTKSYSKALFFRSSLHVG